MYRRLQEKRQQLKALRQQKRQLIAELRSKRQAKKQIDEEMSRLRTDIKKIKGIGEEF